ncbi:FAD-dependent oxidoreductase [Salipaludibacillus neizhouensis]|uniref:FAD-dependent oxidoreductase n=1 Tax=Salipaludibacillus neizhouensis TaxID=885475 RepID=A0A3A9KE66_9BACI|nr:FAD-dependent oxidoreductase [Salipaludibacillus neizhouensis]RKL67923.1 FAD-dependent oxidoreductase [Salipaludibacillus neizhouensis]
MSVQKHDSYWLDSTNLSPHEPLTENIKTEVAVVGGGITGITAAYLLAKEGKKVILLEADRLFHGTTGFTTAKITSQHGLFYDELIQHVGEEKARIYYQTNEKAKKFIEAIVNENNIDCDFEKKDAVLYAVSKKSNEKLEKEIKAYEELGIPHEVVHELPYNVKIERALHMKDQAQFHPLHYLSFLVDEFLKLGGKLFEHTVVVDVLTNTTGDQPKTLETRDGHTITCEHLLSCSHFPFYDRENLFFSRLHAERSYIVAAKGKDVPGMYINVDSPSRSVRSVKIKGETHLLLGGEGHKTGQGKSTTEHFQALEAFGRDVFGSEEFPFEWSTQDLYTLDKIPYIGVLTGNITNSYVATGYRKWGMTSGTAAGLILRDYVLGHETEEMDLYQPDRFIADPSVKQLLKHNSDVAGHFLAGKITPSEKKLEDVQVGEGIHVVYDGLKSGAYRDDDGKLHIVDTTCKHMGCEVAWNSGELTWDCPCHGSRYNFDGTVIEGPAKEPLDKLY